MSDTISHYHKFQYLANQTVNWLGTDTQLNWQRNLSDPQRRKQLQKYQFDREDSITYSFNQHGFRCRQFDKHPGFIALGCSFTQGIGLPQHQIWPELIADCTGLSAWNLGVGACSLDTCFRLLYHWIDLLEPQFVMLLVPDISRFEFFLDNDPVSFNSQVLEHEIQKHWYAQEQNQLVNAEKNLMAMEQICCWRSVKLIVADLESAMFSAPQQDLWPAARDLMHSGHASHRYCAEYFLQKLNQN